MNRTPSRTGTTRPRLSATRRSSRAAAARTRPAGPYAAALTHSTPPALSGPPVTSALSRHRPPPLKPLPRNQLRCSPPCGTRHAMASARGSSRLSGAQARRDALVRAARVLVRDRQGGVGGSLRAPIRLLAWPSRRGGRAVPRLRHLRAGLRPHPTSDTPSGSSPSPSSFAPTSCITESSSALSAPRPGRPSAS